MDKLSQKVGKNTKNENCKPFFSVIIPTLDEEKCLPHLLNDLVKQTFTNFEVTIVDAKSKDKTQVNAEKFKDKFQNFQFITSNKKGVSYQRNLGASKAKSNWLVFMDADNRIPHYFLQGIKYRVECLNSDILSSWIKADSNNRKDKSAATIANIFTDMQKSTKNPYVIEAFLCIKKQSFKKLKGFDETLPWSEGSDLLRRAVRKRMRFDYLKDPKYQYSFRRLRSLGTFKSIRNAATIELARLTKIDLSQKRYASLYPMEGGSYYEIDKRTSTRIKSIFNKIMQDNPVTKNGNSLANWLFKKKK